MGATIRPGDPKDSVLVRAARQLAATRLGLMNAGVRLTVAVPPIVVRKRLRDGARQLKRRRA